MDDPTGPMQEPPARPEEKVSGLAKSAQKANRADRDESNALKAKMDRWIKAGDVSQIEIDKIRRQIAAIERRLPPEKPKFLKKRKKRPKARRRKTP